MIDISLTSCQKQCSQVVPIDAWSKTAVPQQHQQQPRKIPSLQLLIAQPPFHNRGGRFSSVASSRLVDVFLLAGFTSSSLRRTIQWDRVPMCKLKKRFEICCVKWLND
mmetsp:Transcript_37427/g.90977  ORF Transcript_37427/g.90977 Transcript_37427/m.90977 type:complete len:108 (-) Transcript_37427:301-624(-)